MTDRLRELGEKVRRREYRRAKIERGIGSAYASLRGSLDWWAQPERRPFAEVMERCLDDWRGRFGAEQVDFVLGVLVAEAEVGDFPPYGGDWRVGT